jgi:hypothetical protein
MATSPLDPANISTRSDRILGRGHGTGALGPSDSSDSGSDVQGAAEALGDAGLDSDTDRNGTGERSSAAPDSEMKEGADIAPDHIEKIDAEEDEEDGAGQ